VLIIDNTYWDATTTEAADNPKTLVVATHDHRPHFAVPGKHLRIQSNRSATIAVH
jgi:hypothetical protein